MAKAHFFKLVRLEGSSYFDLENPSVQLSLGRTIHQPKLDRAQNCVWVYRSAEAALGVGYEGVNKSSSDLSKSTKTILKCSVWGDCVNGSLERFAFSFLSPVADIGIKSGFVAYKVLRRPSRIPYGEPLKPISPRRVKPRLVQSTIRNRGVNQKSPFEASLVSQLRSRRRLASSVLRPKPRNLPRLDYRQTLAKMQEENARLEDEIAEIERRAAELDLED
jgi:hypothetical protein